MASTSSPPQRNVRAVLAGVAVVILGAAGMAWSAVDDEKVSAPEPPAVAPAATG